MTKTELAQKVFKVSYLKGTFKLRSGQISNEYFDKYKFESDPELLRLLAKHMAPLILPDTQILAGLELGGVPLATALSLETGIPLIFVRKKEKQYGTQKIAEGLEFSGKKVCVIEDVITTGGQVIESCQELKKQGAMITQVISVILRGSGKELAEQGLNLNSLFTMDELKNSAVL